jgi:hypothetical protein
LEQIDPVVWNIAAIAVVRRNAANARNQPRPVTRAHSEGN